MTIQSLPFSQRRGDGHLWMIALGLSLCINLILVALVGMAALKSAEFRKKIPPPVQTPPVSVVMIYPEFTEGSPATVRATAPEKRFARTTEDQAAAPEKKNAPLIGERDTRATSDRAPLATAPMLPSQAGIERKDETDIETTESNYQDGSLSANSPAPQLAEEIPTPPAPESPPPPEESTAADPSDLPGPDAIRNPPPPRETLLEGPNPVDVQVPREIGVDEQIKPSPEKRSATNLPPPPKPTEIAKTAESSPPKPSSDPTFSGFQRKTAVVGSISRTGRSALDVANTALGRYQATISRAVELEWQRNCVRHRDFITPGFLTIRFFVEPSGKVRSVQFVGDMETGEVQKGFTLNSIRNAKIPAMPEAVRKEFDEDPLELIFRFYF